MPAQQHQNTSAIANAVWPLLFLTAILHAYIGLSSVAYVFMGVSNPASGPGAWVVAVAGGLQAAAAVAAFLLAIRQDLRRTTLALAGGILLGWFAELPGVLAQGLDFRGDDAVSAIHFALSPAIAAIAAALAWRNRYPVAAAFVVSATTVVGILVVLAFALIIAVHGF